MNRKIEVVYKCRNCDEEFIRDLTEYEEREAEGEIDIVVDWALYSTPRRSPRLVNAHACGGGGAGIGDLVVVRHRP